jgi:hypothetical protein
MAHVDTPKGDLDGSADSLSGPSTAVYVRDVYGTWGTSELYPYMTYAGTTVTQDQTAHWYMECSNKGLCDRKTGLCKCFTGYEGHACQRGTSPSARAPLSHVLDDDRAGRGS